MFFSIYADKNLTRLREPPPLIFGKKGGNGAKNSYFFFPYRFCFMINQKIVEGDSSLKNHLVPRSQGNDVTAFSQV